VLRTRPGNDLICKISDSQLALTKNDEEPADKVEFIPHQRKGNYDVVCTVRVLSSLPQRRFRPNGSIIIQPLVSMARRRMSPFISSVGTGVVD
jgi:hypothetical protein